MHVATKTFLSLDDNWDNRLGVSTRLRTNHDHTVFSADALHAMSVALKEKCPTTILRDLGLPGGNGLRVMQRLKTKPSCESRWIRTIT